LGTSSIGEAFLWKVQEVRNEPIFARAKAGRACILVHHSLTRECFFGLISSGAISSSIRFTNGTAAISAIE
jgi:hypothetical protein